MAIDLGRVRPITRRSVEQIYRRAMTGSESGAAHLVNKGVRAARARDPYLMRGLEQCAEIITQMAEEQRGATRRGASVSRSEAVESTEAQIFKKAYEHADRGDALTHYGWIYGAVGEYVGIFS